MSDEFFNMYLYFVAICYVIAIAIWISKKVALKGSYKVSGRVVDVVPQYRSAKYTVIINEDGTKVPHTFYKRSWFGGKGIGSTFHFYSIPTPEGYKYKLISSYYSMVWALLVMPWHAIFSAAF